MITQSSAIFKIPVEIRLDIYALVGEDSDYQLQTPLLRVCHQIRAEALPTVLNAQRKSFHNVDKLSRWTSNGYPHLLQHWGDISLTLEEDSLRALRKDAYQQAETASTPHGLVARYRELLNQLSEEDRTSPLRPEWYRDYTDSGNDDHDNSGPGKVEELISSLAAVRKIKFLWMYMGMSWRLNWPPDSPVPDFSVEYQLSVEVISHYMKNLRQLVLQFDNCRCQALVSLDFLKGLGNLRSLSFSGYSKSTPEETLELLRCLEHFEELKIFPGGSKSSIPKNTDMVSITPHVIRHLRPLKSLDIAVVDTTRECPFLTTAMIAALYQHTESLEKLHLSWDDWDTKFDMEFPLDAAVFEEVVGLVAALSRVKNLYLCFRLPPEYKEFDIKAMVPESAVNPYTNFRFEDHVKIPYVMKYVWGG
ncbi:hypothetical protein K432DRAFT_430660 [Lepidopterella palustris CBS 459.81]|uniref:Uncharacterized protein n=1 Tax=Lepidopterella palustris CBS 459.81 TaxID=1314670 RepID=A0A8E2DXG5_9PEZI|nr:hypothetical protein K432DRAFT_430660 [Lepidopterella palustris CBS 459.81]